MMIMTPAAELANIRSVPRAAGFFRMLALAGLGGVLAGGSVRAATFFGFDDGTLQGWTDLTAAGTHAGPRHWAPSPPAFPSGSHQGGLAIGQFIVGGGQDSAHPTLWLRSPEFELDGSGNVSAWLRGGTGSGSLAGTSVSALPTQSGAPGFQGIALRNADTGQFVLSGSKVTNGDHWENVVFTAAQLAVLDQNATYTLDLIDAGHGGWGWVALDTVNIPGTLTGTAAQPVAPEPVERLGPSSRRTGWVISEIMYRPGAFGGAEFLEIHNSKLVPRDLGGHRLEGAINFTFPPGTTVAPGGFVVVAADPAALQAAHGIGGVLGPYSGSLDRQSGEILLRHPMGPVLLEAAYSSLLDWPAAANGAGHSLVLAKPSYGEADVRAWAPGRHVGGTPGADEPAAGPDPYEGVFINEFLANTQLPQLDFIEIHNDGPAAVDLSGCWLSDKPDEDRFQMPADTVLEAGGYLVVYETELGFALSSSGEGIYLRTPDASRLIDALRFIAQESGVASGRWPDAAAGIRELASPTPGGPNSAPRIPDVVINEIHYHPLSGDEDETFVELHNHSVESIDVSGWQIADGIRFTIPPATAIAPGGFLVIAKDRSRLLAIYPQLDPAITLGGFSGRLARSGERITLLKPGPSGGLVLVDEVHYRDGGAWHGKADGDGSSLERTDPRANGRLAPNWAASDESGRAGWTHVEHTGVLDNGTGFCNQVHLMLLGGGECLVDNIEVRVGGGQNLVSNGGFGSGLTGWSITGNHVESTLSAAGAGFGGGRALHLRASGGGDTGANVIRANLSSFLFSGQTVTIRAKIRWLGGHPTALVRLRGNYLEAVGELDVPAGGGTPGRANSRATANAGPAITAVRHHPPMPAPGQPVTVLADVEDPDGLDGVSLRYRIDPSATLISVPMQRNGPRGQWIAVIPGQWSGQLAAFHITAADAAPQPRNASFPAAAPAAECLIRWGEPPVGGDFGHYRFWLTQAVHNEWSTREKLSNHRLDSTFVYQGSRIIYNAGGRFRGSPFIRPSYDTPTGNLSSYVFGFPGDEPFLGASQMNLDNLEPSRDPTRQSEKMSFWLGEQLAAPFINQRYIVLHINGVRRDQVFTDSQHLDADFIKSWFPEDREGAFHKIDDWFEFNTASGGFTSQINGTLQNFTTTGGEKKKARYRWSWEKRRSVFRDDDFTELFALVDALNTPPGSSGYVAGIEQRVNPEKWLRTLALRRLVGDWDSYGYNRGKNMSAYKPVNDGWHLISWDIDFTLGAGSNGPQAGLFNSHDPVIASMLANPKFRRIYLRAFHDAVHGPFQGSAMNPVMNAYHSSFVANGLSISAPASISSWVRERRTFILSELAAVGAPFAITTNSGQNFTSPSAQVTLQGSAPVEVAQLHVNGVPWPVEWTTVNTWRIVIPLGGGANSFAITGTNIDGMPIAGLAANVSVTYDGIIDEPEGHLVINEIMMQPEVPGAEFVEIHNRSESTFFDLTGYRLRGVAFDFAPGTVIAPGAFLLVVRDAAVFAATYGSTLPVAGTYPGVLQPEGEQLRLVKLATANEPERLISEVTYSSAPPWPQAAAGGGASLQLVDPSHGTHHIGNWAASNADDPPTWQYVVLTGSNLGDRLYLYMNQAGEAFIDDMHLSAGTVPESGPNLLVNGNFESPLSSGWLVASNHASSSITTAVKRSGNSSLHMVATSPGVNPIVDNSIYQPSSVWANGGTYTLSFWYLPQQNGPDVTFRFRLAESRPESINYSFNTGIGFASGSTPGQPNSVARTLPPFPDLHINEVQMLNASGPADSTGTRGPWLELYHGDDEELPLDGFFLSDDPTNLAGWQFPPTAAISSGGFRMVWLDGRDHLTTADEWHAGFALPASSGSLTLSRMVDGISVVISHLDFPALPDNISYGPWPDGGVETFLFPVPTPGSSNVYASPQVAEIIMPRFMQGAVPNSDRVPFAFRVRLSGLLPAADYRVANRVIVPTDPPTQNGAGNQVFVTSTLPYPRTTQSPGFLPGDFLTGHNRITTDATGAYEGWFITEPSGNARFTPGNTVFIRMLLNDGQEGVEIAHFLDCPSPVQVVSFGTGPTDGTAIQGTAASQPGDFVLLHDGDPSDRPVAATSVEKSLSLTGDSYATFYQTDVWPHDHAWGAMIPNSLSNGITGVSEYSRSIGDMVSETQFDGPWPGTVNASGGLAPILIDAVGRFPFWQRAQFPDPADLANPAISGPAADGLGLGVSNLLAYALGLEPGHPENLERRLSLLKTPSGASLRFPRDPRKVDIAYLLAASQDLGDWSETLFDSRDDFRPNNDGDFLSIDDPEEAAARRFFSLQIIPLDP